MSAITPQTDVYLLKVPLEIDNDNQLTFANATAQHTYFNGLPKIALDNFTYQRKDGTIRVPYNIDDIINYNYVMYRNEGFSNKWFYAYITGMEFLNPSTTLVSIKTDTFQTWQFDLTYKPTFIEREHTNDDTVGSNLIPEGLEHGEYVMNGDVIKMSQYNHIYYVINADKAPSTDSSGIPTGDTVYYGVNTGGLPMSGNLFLFNNMETLTNAFLTYSRMQGGIDHVKNVYVANEFTINGNDYEDGDFELDEYAYYKYKGRSTPVEITSTVSAPTSLQGYTPRNKKLLSAPYQYMLLSNNNGAVNELDYEYFSDRTNMVIKAKGVPTVGGSIVAYPINYKGTIDNYNEGIMGGKLPTLSWSGDAWTNWLTQNAVNIGTNTVTNALGIGASALIGGLTGGVGAVIGLTAGMRGVNAVADQLTEKYNHSIVANTFSGNTNGGDVSTAGRMNNIYIWKMSITSQFAERLDSYFDLYGYQTNKVKMPNITGRRNWNYVKTVGCYIEADIPQDDLQEIKTLFDKGITLWHNPATFADYTQANDII